MENSGNTELNYCYNCMAGLESGQTVCPYCGYDNHLRNNPDNLLPEGAILAGKYLVGKMLGQGGFGVTYLGVDLLLNLRVAIKEYFPAEMAVRSVNSIHVISDLDNSGDDGFQKGCREFQTEARTLAQFDSPNIVHVRDYFLENGTAYIVMDFVEGNSLTKEVTLCGGRIPWERVVSLFKPLILELGKLHDRHLIHRDIKPDNIYLEKDPKSGEERLVLLDFGSARRYVTENITKTFTAMVTPGYAPIEQYAQKSRQGPYTDIYSLCATMYALITGRKPANATDLSVGADRIEPIHDMGIAVPVNVEKAILHGLEVKGEDRPQSMKELYEELTDPIDLTGKEKHSGSSGKQNSDILLSDNSGSGGDENINGENSVEGGKRKNKIVLIILAVLILTVGVISILLYLQKSRSEKEDAVQTQTAAVEISINADETLSAESAIQTETAAASAAEEEAAQTATQEAVGIAMTELASTQSAMAAAQTKAAEPTITNTPQPSATETAALTPSHTPTAVDTFTPTAVITLRPVISVKAGDQIKFGSYEQDNDLNNGKEAIEWLVLDVRDDRALLISKYVLDTRLYDNSLDFPTWEFCTLRTWLNEEFIRNAFNSDEIVRVIEVTNDNPDYSNRGGSKGGNPTRDKVFLLSNDEVYQYFPTEEERICTATAYAKSTGAYNYDTQWLPADQKMYEGNTEWWLRSTNQSVWVTGRVDLNWLRGHGLSSENGSTGVRPAFWLDLSDGDPSGPAATNMPLPTATNTPDPELPVKMGEYFVFGSYEQDNNRNNGPEPIEWQVLTIDDGRALLLSRYGLDIKKYNETNTEVTWETCTLREWLNNDFYNSAFSSVEKNQILTVTNDKHGNIGYGRSDEHGGNPTSDRVFLLSMEENITYLVRNQDRRCEGTAYVLSLRADRNKSTENPNVPWWLRSPGNFYTRAIGVEDTGMVGYFGYDVITDYVAVRPAFWLNLSASGSFDTQPSVTIAAEEPQPLTGKTMIPEIEGRLRPVASVTPEPAAASESQPAFTISLTPQPEDDLKPPAGRRISVKMGDVIQFGSYEQDNNLSNGAEHIEWQVLTVEDGRALLLSRYGLDAMKYNDSETAVTWETSSLRKWLNGDFCNNAFSSEDKAGILEVTNRNPNNPGYGTGGGDDTADRIFLLSINEANELLPDNAARKCGVTAYAKAEGAYLSGDVSRWWLRSPGEDGTKAAFVSTGGAVFSRGDSVIQEYLVIRPAFWLEIDGNAE